MKSIITGFIIGLLLPVIAIFVGLQVSPALANILLFPTSLVSQLFDQPFGDLPNMARIGLWLFSGVFWACVFWLAGRFGKKRKPSNGHS